MTNNRPQFEMSADTKIIRSALEECEVGQTISYETLDKAIGRNCREHAIGSIVTARRSLQASDNIVFACVTNVGYKRLNNAEIVSSMERDRKHISKASNRAMKKLSCVEFEKLTDEQKKEHTVSAAQFGVLRMLASSSSTKKITAKATNSSETLPIGETLSLFVN